MVAKRQISIAFPQQLQVSDAVGSLIEQVLASLLHGGVAVVQQPSPVSPVAPPPTFPPEPAPGDSSLLSAIDGASSDPRLQIAMRLGALLEGGSLTGPWGVGDNGQSFGPFQIYLVAHPDVTAAQASDPGFAVQYMLSSYEGALNDVPGDLWQSDPKLAAAQTVFLAERPRDFYPQDRIDAAWQEATVTPMLPVRTAGG